MEYILNFHSLLWKYSICLLFFVISLASERQLFAFIESPSRRWNVDSRTNGKGESKTKERQEKKNEIENSCRSEDDLKRSYWKLWMSCWEKGELIPRRNDQNIANEFPLDNINSLLRFSFELLALLLCTYNLTTSQYSTVSAEDWKENTRYFYLQFTGPIRFESEREKCSHLEPIVGHQFFTNGADSGIEWLEVIELERTSQLAGIIHFWFSPK